MIIGFRLAHLKFWVLNEVLQRIIYHGCLFSLMLSRKNSHGSVICTFYEDGIQIHVLCFQVFFR